MSKVKLIHDIENLIVKGLENCPLPVQNGKTIRIGRFVVRPDKHSTYTVVDSKNNRVIASTQYKSSALAVARQAAKGKNLTNTVEKLDKELAKHDNDIQFYKHTMNNDPVIERKYAAQSRYDIAIVRVKHLIRDLERYIYY